MAETLPAQTELTEEMFHELIAGAVAGDERTLPALRELLKVPGAVEVLGGNLAQRARTALISWVSGKNLLCKESVEHKLTQLRLDLAGSNPTPLESLLVDRIVTCWLHLHDLDMRYSQKQEACLEVGLYYQRCIDRAQKRYLSAIKTLAVVRRLALPALQVNIANKQQVKNA